MTQPVIPRNLILKQGVEQLNKVNQLSCWLLTKIKIQRIKIMSHELFIDVTAEQQEIVAGGASLLDLETFFKSYSKTIETIGPVAATSGPSGSTVASAGIGKLIETFTESGNFFTAIVG
jgi:hypothetical protein